MDVANEMANNPLYAELFWGAFGSTTIAQIGSDLIYFAMLYFGGYHMTLAAGLAILGASLGMSVNFAIGWLFSKVQDMGVSKLEQALYEKWQRRVTYIMPLIGLLSFIQLMGTAVVVAGFLRVNRKLAVLSIVVGQLVYYSYYQLS